MSFQYLGKIAKELDYELVMVTNQDGLGTDSFPEDTFWPVQNFILKAFENEGVKFSVKSSLIGPFLKIMHHTRKPRTGLLRPILILKNMILKIPLLLATG